MLNLQITLALSTPAQGPLLPGHVGLRGFTLESLLPTLAQLNLFQTPAPTPPTPIIAPNYALELAQVSIGLVLAIAIIYVSALLLLRLWRSRSNPSTLNPSKHNNTAPHHALAIVARQRLDPHTTLYIITADGQRILIACAAGSTTTLANLTHSPPHAPAPQAPQATLTTTNIPTDLPADLPTDLPTASPQLTPLAPFSSHLPTRTINSVDTPIRATTPPLQANIL